MPSDWTAADRKWVCTEVPLPRRTLVKRSGRSRSPPSGTWHCACCWSSACRSDGNFPVAVFPRTSLFCVKSFEVRSVQFVSLDETTLNHQLNDRLVTYSARHRNIPCWISNIKEFHAKSHNQFSSLLLKSSSKSTFHHKILPGTGDDVTSIERLVTYWIAVHPATGLAYGYIILPMVSIPRWWVATWGLFSK